MGLKNDPNEYPPEFGIDCSLCYPAGETPKYLYLNIAGIELCPAASPSLPSPANGLWRLEPSAPCIWSFDNASYGLILVRSVGTSFLTISSISPDFVQFFASGNQCQTEYDTNEEHCGISNYFGGSVKIYTQRKEFYLSLNLDILSDKNAWLDLFNETSSGYIERIVNPKDNTNILTKLDMNQ